MRSTARTTARASTSAAARPTSAAPSGSSRAAARGGQRRSASHSTATPIARSSSTRPARRTTAITSCSTHWRANESRAANWPATRSSATVMSNIGFERALARDGIEFVRAAVGDRYVLEAMRAGRLHAGRRAIRTHDRSSRNTTGDGPMTAISLLGSSPAQRTTLRELVREVVSRRKSSSTCARARGVLDARRCASDRAGRGGVSRNRAQALRPRRPAPSR